MSGELQSVCYVSFGQVHTRLLTHKWHELLVLTTSAYQAIHGAHKLGSTSSDGTEADFTQEVSSVHRLKAL
jgi:nuclear receptor subfamily 6 group A